MYFGRKWIVFLKTKMALRWGLEEKGTKEKPQS